MGGQHQDSLDSTNSVPPPLPPSPLLLPSHTKVDHLHVQISGQELGMSSVHGIPVLAHLGSLHLGSLYGRMDLAMAPIVDIQAAAVNAALSKVEDAPLFLYTVHARKLYILLY